MAGADSAHERSKRGSHAGCICARDRHEVSVYRRRDVVACCRRSLETVFRVCVIVPT